MPPTVYMLEHNYSYWQMGVAVTNVTKSLNEIRDVNNRKIVIAQ